PSSLFNIIGYLLTACILLWILLLHHLCQFTLFIRKKFLSVHPLKQEFDMCDEPLIMQASFIQPDPQLSGDDIKNIFHLIWEMEGVPDICSVFCVHKMQRDKSCLILRQTHMKPLPDQIDRISAQPVFLRIKSLDLPQKRVL